MYSNLLNNHVEWQFFVLPAELFPLFSKISKYAGFVQNYSVEKSSIRLSSIDDESKTNKQTSAYPKIWEKGKEERF